MATRSLRLFPILSLLRFASAQIFGCDGPNVECPTGDSDAKGACAYSDYGIGVVPFDSNITSDAPLTWTATTIDDARDNSPLSVRRFWLGTPPSLNLTNTTAFGACSMVFQPSLDLTSMLQLPPGAELNDFTCGTVMGDDCARDFTSRIREEATRAVENGDVDARFVRSPCAAIRESLATATIPESCIARFRAETYGFRNSYILTNGTESDLDIYRSQYTCSITTGGSEYSTLFGGDTNYPASPSSEANQLFKNGTTPIVTMFYNEPWNNATTGPFPGLMPSEPEVHVHCLRTLPTEEQIEQSSSTTCTIPRGSELTAIFWIPIVLAAMQWLT